MSPSDSVLSLENVSVSFESHRFFGLGRSETIHAVDDVSLEIPENDIIALVGESGCGKTTLGKTAIGLQRPTDGSVKYRGQDIWEARQAEKPFRGTDVDIPYSEIRRSLQIIHQDPESALNSNYRVRTLIGDPLKRWEPDLTSQDRRERIHGLLEYVGMSPPADYANRYPHQLSGGEQQRVALIRALVVNPDVILADEAISALDVSLRVDMMDLLLELQDQFNTSFLFISHNLSNAKYLAEMADGRIGIMYLGELVEIGTPEQIIHDPQHPYTKVLLWATSDLHAETGIEDPPVRSLDIPDASDPPSGCRFHTRCPEARRACTREKPEFRETENGSTVACFRQFDDHEYWDSEPLESGDVTEQSSAL